MKINGPAFIAGASVLGTVIPLLIVEAWADCRAAISSQEMTMKGIVASIRRRDAIGSIKSVEKFRAHAYTPHEIYSIADHNDSLVGR